MKRLILALITIGIFVYSCDKNNYSEMNQDPSTITEPDLVYLFTQAVQDMEQDHYTQWFYDNSEYMLPWTQVTSGQGGPSIPQGNGSELNLYKEAGDRVGKWYNLMSPLFEIRHFIDNEFSGEKQVSYQKLEAITYAVQIYYGIRVTDVYGSRPYTEAMQARYTNPPMLTPKWDTQEELFTTWLTELNNALDILESTPEFNGKAINQVSPSDQDFVYGGNWTKWAKFINSLKLRIAVRLLHQDKQKAINIAETVMNDQYGPITDMTDNFNWTASVQYYGPADDFVAFAPGAKNLIDFLRKNKDPRLRFLFDKNDFNSMVIQAFYDAGLQDNIPSYIRKYTKDTLITSGSVYDGKTVQQDSLVFTGWKAPGEPWVRYYGGPVAPDSARSGQVAEEYFRTQNWRLGSKTYEPKSLYKLELFGTNIDITYPDIPSRTVQNKQDNPYHNCLYSAAETNLYLAEFKLLGANLSNTAEHYFQTGVQQSVETYDWMARNNGIIYYDAPYDTKFGAAVGLQPGEIQQLLTESAYTLSGSVSEQLEKVYIQEFVNFLGHPTQLFVTSLRSGVPESNSNYLARVPFWDGGVSMVIPRRFGVDQPTQDNINYQNILDGLKAEGFTPGSNNPQVLHDERVWFDKDAPDWGEGPNY